MTTPLLGNSIDLANYYSFLKIISNAKEGRVRVSAHIRPLDELNQHDNTKLRTQAHTVPNAYTTVT